MGKKTGRPKRAPATKRNKPLATASPPSEGERRAAGGLYYQYRVAAYVVLRNLKERSLKWIRVADPAAGRVDDFVCGSDAGVDGYQMKSALYGGSFTFRDLVVSKKGAPPLIAQLAGGWETLREVYPGRRVRVHLITNEGPSVADSVPGSVSSNGARHHFAAFLEQCWKPAQQTDLSRRARVPRKWAVGWSTLKKASKLEGRGFLRFVEDCVFEFGTAMPVSVGHLSRESDSLEQDLKAISEFLFSTVASPQKIVHLDYAQLLQGLGWTERFEYRSRHEFPVDARTYQPIRSSVRFFQNRLEQISGGYVAVLGTPGSGKSTLVTHTLAASSYQVVRYYAYVPDSQDPTVLRGESVNFLHDVVLSLDNLGFKVGETPHRFDRPLLLDRFHKQMQLASGMWKKTGRKTIVLVDGLDHIAREQNPQHSLISDLPYPEQVPEGVLIVLGSQTDIAFPDRIQAQIRHANRRMEMELLNRMSVFRVADRVGLRVKLSRERKEEIYRLSGGHPLALQYLLNRILDKASDTEIEAALNAALPYSGTIENEYHSYWRQVENDVDLVHLVGLLARLRTVVDLGWMEKWARADAIRKLTFSFGHYFRKEDGKRWYFFHNSYRVFLLNKTAESPTHEFDIGRHREFHKELADLCAAEPPASPWAWEELYHRSQCGEHATVLKKAQPNFFRSQFVAFRPLDAVKRDAQLALGSALESRDVPALCRLVFCGAEAESREWHLEMSPYLDLLVDLGHQQAVTEYIRDGSRLRVKNEVALSLSIRMFDAGWKDEGKRTFDLAEPLDLLHSSEPIENDRQEENSTTLLTWAEAASRFRQSDEVLRMIAQVRVKQDDFKRTSSRDETQSVQSWLLYRLAVGLISQGAWTDLRKVESRFKLDRDDGVMAWFYVQREIWQAYISCGDIEHAIALFGEALEKINLHKASAAVRITLAEFALTMCQNPRQARGFIDGLKQPPVESDLGVSDRGMQPFLYRFRLNRILYALGEKSEPAKLLPLPANEHYHGAAYFERAVGAVARLWGNAWRREIVPTSELLRECHPLLRFFARTPKQTRDWHYWYIVKGARAEFFSMMVRAVALYGPEAVNKLKEKVDMEWSGRCEVGVWPADAVRETVLALWRAGVEKDWAITKLRGIEQWMLSDQDVAGKMRECRSQADAWSVVDDRASAESSLRRMLDHSMGVGYRKDYQTDEWIEWLGEVTKLQRDAAPTRFTWFAKAIPSLEETTEGRATNNASLTLLEKAFDWSPVRSVKLLSWLLAQGLVDFEDALSLMLTKVVTQSPGNRGLVVSVFGDVLLPISVSSDGSLTDAIVSAAHSSGGATEAMQVATEIIALIDEHGMPSARVGWRNGVANALLRFGMDIAKFGLKLPRESDGAQDGGELKLKTGEVLTIAEALARVKDAKGLRKLLKEEAEDSFFPWEKLVAKFVARANGHDLAVLAEVLEERKGTSEVLIALSTRARELGNVDLAGRLAKEAVKISKPYGWVPSYDGGSKLLALQALESVDRAAGQRMAFEAIVSDLGAGIISFQPVAQNLRNILPLLQLPAPIAEVWPSVEDYVTALFAGSVEQSIQGPELADAPRDDVAIGALYRLLESLLSSPVTRVAIGTRSSLAFALLKADSRAIDVLAKALQSTDAEQEAGLIILDAATRMRKSLPDCLVTRLAVLDSSPDFAIRTAAEEIGSRLGVSASRNDAKVELPAIYRFALPPSELDGPEVDGTVDGGEPLPDSENPEQIVRPFGTELDAIASETGIARANIYYRCVQIMKNLSPADDWSAEAEKKLREQLRGIGLRFPFHRPRAAAARRAMLRVVAECVDAGLLDTDRNGFSRLLRFYDPYFVTGQPSARPREIESIGGVSDSGMVKDEWLSQGGDALSSICRNLSGGFIVIGEETRLKGLGWELPEENRLSSLVDPSIGPSDEDLKYRYLFNTLVNACVSDYPTSYASRTLSRLLVRNEGYGFETPGADWLALNPAVGRLCGWQLSDSGLFEWHSVGGELMVKSIWWVDGNVDHAPPHHQDQVGEGWIVVASQRALESLSKCLGPFERQAEIVRSARINDRHMRTFASKRGPV